MSDNTSAEGKAALQSTPYLIWNNFEDEPTQARVDMSMLQLLPYMTQALDMDRPGFHSYMDGLFEQVRAVTRGISLDGDGTPVFTLSEEAQSTFDDYLTVFVSIIRKHKIPRFTWKRGISDCQRAFWCGSTNPFPPGEGIGLSVTSTF